MVFRYPLTMINATHRDKTAHGFVREFVAQADNDGERRARLGSLRLAVIVDVLHRREPPPPRDAYFPAFVTDFSDFLECGRRTLLAWYRVNGLDPAAVETDCALLGT